MGIHISACMKPCHGSWQPPNSSSPFQCCCNIQGAILFPFLSENSSFFVCFVCSTRLSFVTKQGFLLCYLSGVCAFFRLQALLDLTSFSFWHKLLILHAQFAVELNAEDPVIFITRIRVRSQGCLSLFMISLIPPL